MDVSQILADAGAQVFKNQNSFGDSCFHYEQSLIPTIVKPQNKVYKIARCAGTKTEELTPFKHSAPE